MTSAATGRDSLVTTPPPRLRGGGRPPSPPPLLWVIAAAVLLPALVPVGGLLVRVAGSASDAIDVALSGRTFRLALNTGVLITLVTAAGATLGIGAAWLTERTDLPGRRVWRVLAALPLVIPSYVIALTLISAFGPRGLLSDATGLTLPSLQGLPGAWLALTISTYPYVYLAAAATLRRLDPALEEAARGLGAPPRRVFRTIVLPQLRPAAAAGMLLVALYTLSDFGAVSLMRFDAFTRVVYAQYAGRVDRTPAAVLAVLLIGIALVVLLAERRTRGRAAYHTNRPSRPAAPMPLTRTGRTWGTIGLGALALISLALPLGTLVTWVVRGPRPAVEWGALSGSLSAASLAAVAAVAAAIPTAVLVTRHRSGLTSLVEHTSYAMFALPHITVGLGMVFFASRYLGGLYQSLPLLVGVYASIFFAQALGPARASLLQVGPHLEEASRSLGSGPLRTMLRVTAPLISRGVAVGAVLVFLTTMKELPVTLLLRPTGFDTLAVDIWSAADDLRYASAAVPALLLVTVSAIPMYLLATRDR